MSIRTPAPGNGLIALILLAVVVPVAASPGPMEDRPAPVERDYTLRLGEIAFDPRGGALVLPDGWDPAPHAGSDLKLVQLEGPTREGELAKLRERGLEIVQYIHPYTYVVWGKDADSQAAIQESFVRWAGRFAPAFRVQPRWRNLAGLPQDVKVLLYRGADTDAAVKAIDALGATHKGRRAINDKFEIVAFEIPGNKIQAAAAIPGVYSIQLQPTDGGLRGELSNQINAGNLVSGQAVPGYRAWLNGLDLGGTGVIMANVDGGVDQNHPDLVNRMLGCAGSTCGGTATGSHGTHTAGIMAADASSGTLDGNGFLRGQGVAPAARLVEQVYSPTFTQPGGMLTLIRESWSNNAPISGNSWGPAGSPQGYDNDTLQVDIGVRDADDIATGNQSFSYVLSFMNGNGGTSSQGSPDEAKNLFNIGSTKAQTAGGAQDPNIDDVSSNSAHGPALDGRTIPHMVAPGCQVDSTDTSGPGYGLKCGTSMASPHVAGATALFFEYYRKLPGYTVDPSPALVKASFLAVARSLAGFDDADGGTLGQPFDSKQGWGRMDLEAVIDPAESVRYFDDPVLFDATGEEWVQQFSPANPAVPVRLMLVWTDAPGHGLGGSTPAWNNDLDLIVEAGPDTYRGNNFAAAGFSVTGGAADFRNNTEGVFLGPVPPGGFTVRVVASNINSDGVPGIGDATDQDFALACYNCAAEPGFMLSADPSSVEVCAPAPASYSIDVQQILGFADPVSLSVSGAPAGATPTFTINPVTPSGTSTLEIADTGSIASGAYVLTVDGSAGALNRTLDVDLVVAVGVPPQVTLSSPADAAVDVGTMPTLEWMPLAGATGYDLQLATDAGFADVVYGAPEAGTSHVLPFALQTLTTYYWRVTASNGCGTGAAPAPRSFTTLDVPPILLVDDDDNSPNVRGSYTAALDALGWQYDVWDTANSDNEPLASEMAPYDTVLWFTGDEFGGVSGPGLLGETSLGIWLDDVGCLLIASQDYYYDRGLTTFMQVHLGLASATSDIGQTSVTGMNAVFGGLGPYGLSFPYTNYTDTIVPDTGAQLAFDGSDGDAAIAKDGGVYRSSFWGFGLEALPTAEDREAVLGALLAWCDALPLADGDADGTSNQDDCAPGNPVDWKAPSAALSLFVELDGPDNVTWNAPAQPGSSSVVYDVLRSDAPADFSAALCVETADADTIATDGDRPLPGDGYYYLVRPRNGCGETLGSATDGPRSGVACN